MGTKNEKDDANTLGLSTHSLIRLRGRGTASAVGGAKFALFRNFCVRCIVKLLVLSPTLQIVRKL